MSNSAVLWTGGKDSCLALHIAREKGFNIVGLVTFVPVGNPEFSAHPQKEMKEQARRLGLSIHFLEVSEPYKDSYIEKLGLVRLELGVETVITGDIDYVAGCSSWICDCCEAINLKVLRPLWLRDREWIMTQLLNRKIKARLSLINHQAIPSDWKGRLIDEGLLRELKAICEKTGIDLAGENGEYHTMVMECPAMMSPVQ